jgi:PAS domain S-box-containing protein
VAKKENIYNVLLKYSAEIYFIVDSNGKITFHSPSYFRILEREETNLLGTPLVSLVSKDNVDSLQQSLQEVKKDDRKTLDVDFHFVKSDGQGVRMHGVLLNYLDESSVKGIVLIAQETASN